MKTIHLNLFLFLIINTSVGAYCQDNKSKRKLDIPTSGEEIALLDSTINLFKAGDFFISGQPNDSIIIALKNQDLKLIINVRTPEEMETMKENGFDEKAFSTLLDIPYINIPIGGDAGFTKKAISDINDAIQLHDGSVMIHCRGAGRATNAWIAWLTNYYEVPLDDAITLGKQMQFNLYLEDLLGYELSYREK